MEEEGSVLCSALFAGLVILGLIFASLLWQYLRMMNFFKKNNVPDRKPLPFFGNTFPMIIGKTSFGEWIQDLYMDFPTAKYFGLFEFTDPTYVLRDPELIKSVGIKYFDQFPDHETIIDTEADPLFGGALTFLKGDRWKEMRSIVTPVFTSSKLRNMFELMSKCAMDFAGYLEKQPMPLTVDMEDIFTRYTNDVVATTVFGISVNSFEHRENEFYMMGKDVIDLSGIRAIKLLLFRWRPQLMKFFKQSLISAKITKFFSSLISETISTRERKGIIRPDLIHQLMQARHTENDEKLTTVEITAQAFIFFLAGMETSPVLMSFTCHQLAIHPDIQEKLIAEIDAAYEEEGDKLSYEKLNHLTYLEMVLNETLRYYPPSVMTERMCIHEFELPPPSETDKPVKLKPGTTVWFPIFAIHRDPTYFPNPEKFDPERFSPENKGNINPFAFIPFGIGPRNCPGRRFALIETKLALCSLLRKFRIRVGAKTQLPLVLSKTSQAMTAERGFWLDLEPRNVAG